MVRLRLNDSALVMNLGTFLQRCECDVEQLGPTTLGVGLRHSIDVDVAVRQLRAGRCYRCGEEIELLLFGLGSPLCADCRDGTAANGDAEIDERPIRDEWAQMEVEAYVKVWQALHPDAKVELVR